MTPTQQTGAEALDRLAGRDLNNDGRIVNLVICGNSKFYDYAWLENAIDEWVKYNAYPDLIILGGASGVDYLAERWADNNNIPLAVFTEAWSNPRPNQPNDSGRPEAEASLVESYARACDSHASIPRTGISLDQTNGRCCPQAIDSGGQCVAPELSRMAEI